MGLVKRLSRLCVVAALWVVALRGAPAAAEPAGAEPARAAEPAVRRAEPASMSAPPRELSGMDDRERVKLPPMTVPLDAPARDRRPFYVGLGLVVMATAFWWNRRQRDRFEREDDRARTPRTRSRPRREAVNADDEDADDLHAAARGETPDPPDRQAP